MSGKAKTTTPIRSRLRVGSTLINQVKEGLGAVDKAHKGYIAEEIRKAFSDSLEIDENLKEGHDQENRWD